MRGLDLQCEALRGLHVAAVICAVYLVVLIRFGFLAGATALASAFVLTSHPLTLDLSAWYAPGSTIALLTVLAVAAYGFKTSMAGTPMLPGEWWRLEESQPTLNPTSD